MVKVIKSIIARKPVNKFQQFYKFFVGWMLIIN